MDPHPAREVAREERPVTEPTAAAPAPSPDDVRSMLAGVLDPGDGSSTASLAPGGSLTFTYAGSGSFAISLTATDGSGALTPVSRPVVVAASA